MRSRTTVIIIGLCVALWGSIYLWHFLLLGDRATGFIHYELPYYLANARAIFTRGNGIMYPNPFNPQPSNHIIYFQWPLWVYGFLMEIIHISPSIVFALATILGAGFMAITTKMLLEERVGKSAITMPILVLAFWGGGLLTLGGWFHGLIHHATWHDIGLDGLMFDPEGGWWMRNWGRNLLFFTESLYHALVALQWLFILRRKWYPALFATIAIGFAHPWTGAEMVLLFLVWILIERMFFRHNANPVPIGVIAGSLLLALAFGWYYGAYLPGFPEHRAIVERWSINWNLTLQSLALELALILPAAGYYLWKKRRPDRDDLFLLTAFLVTLALTKHDLFFHPVQPAHFDHGYLWMALFLLALPAITDIYGRLPHFKWRLAAAAIVLIGVLDNAYFLVQKLEEGSNSELVVLGMSNEFYPLFEHLRNVNARGTLLTPDPISDYLSALYTNCVPYVGHGNLTPDIVGHKAHLEVLNSGVAGRWLDSCDYIIRPRRDVINLDTLNKRPITSTKDFVLYGTLSAFSAK